LVGSREPAYPGKIKTKQNKKKKKKKEKKKKEGKKKQTNGYYWIHANLQL